MNNKLLEPAHSTEYIRDNGAVTVYIRKPLDGHFEIGTIAVLTIQVTTPSDPYGKCTARMDINVVNPYRIGYFDEPQQIQWSIGVRELRVLRSFPWLHDILISDSKDYLSLPEFIDAFVKMGGIKSKSYDTKYEELKMEFDMSSGPTFLEYLRPN